MNPLKHFLDSFWTKKYYWYEVRYIYSTKDGVKILDWVTQIGVCKKQETLNRRGLKKTVRNLHGNKTVRKYLCNGLFSVEVLCYLGRFEKRN
jgi:hypothetical protein